MHTLKYYYDKGKEDGAKDVYHPPHGIIDALTIWDTAANTHNTEENIAYTKGYFYAKGIEHYKISKYEPPFAEEHKAAYDEGYNGKSGNKTVR